MRLCDLSLANCTNALAIDPDVASWRRTWWKTSASHSVSALELEVPRHFLIRLLLFPCSAMLCGARGTQLRPLVGTLVAICPPLSFLRNETLLLGSEMKRRTSFYSTSKNLHLNGRFWLAMGTISLFIGWYFGAGSGCGDFRGGSKRKGISHLMIPT